MNRASYLLGVSAILSVAGLSLGNVQAAVADTIDIGMVESLTGGTAVAGTANLCGAQIATQMLNDEGGILGKQVRLVVEDDQSKPAVATPAAAKLTGQGIKYFVGGASSNTVLAEIPVFADAKALFTGGTAKADQVLTSGGLVLRINSNNAQDGAIIADYVSKTLHADKVSAVALFGAYGEGAIASVEAALGPETKLVGKHFAPPDTVNFQSIITTISSESPGAVVFAIFPDTQNVALMRQYKQFGLTMPLVGAVGVLSGSLVKAAGDAAEGLVSADIWVSSLDNPENQKLQAAFEKYKGQQAACGDAPLNKQLAITYSQVLLIAKAMEKTKLTDPAALRDAIMQDTWDLPQGSVAFGADGQVKASYHMTIVKGGEVVPYNP